MGFCGDWEDINFLLFIVVYKFMERNLINFNDIGRFEVGIEILIDKLKFVKSVFM